MHQWVWQTPYSIHPIRKYTLPIHLNVMAISKNYCLKFLQGLILARTLIFHELFFYPNGNRVQLHILNLKMKIHSIEYHKRTKIINCISFRNHQTKCLSTSVIVDRNYLRLQFSWMFLRKIIFKKLKFCCRLVRGDRR